MKALHRHKEASRRERDKNTMFEECFSLVVAAVLLEMHDEWGFGAKRIEKLHYGVLNRINEAIDRYGDDCASFALNKKLDDELDIKIKFV